jgi:hypothetical protein
VYLALRDLQPRIELPEPVLVGAAAALRRMFELGRLPSA